MVGREVICVKNSAWGKYWCCKYRRCGEFSVDEANVRGRLTALRIEKRFSRAVEGEGRNFLGVRSGDGNRVKLTS